jgi:hypothetical protein
MIIDNANQEKKFIVKNNKDNFLSKIFNSLKIKNHF